MATLKEIATAAEKADRAGNTEDAKKLVNLYFRMMEKNIKKETTSPSLTDKDVKLKESSNNPLAQNPNTSASGLYQITDAAKKDAEAFDSTLVGSDYSKPEVQERYRKAYKSVLSKQLKSKGVEDSIDNINRAWVIGAGGMSLLNKAQPEQMLIDVLPESYFKKNKEGNFINPNLINKSVDDFMNDPDPYSRKIDTIKSL
jgi:hypothetical protein